jgi:hypothetical protein
MTVVISDLYIALERAGFPLELARAVSDVRLPSSDAATKQQLLRDVAETFEARGVDAALAYAAASAIVMRLPQPNAPQRKGDSD